ncbi:PhzF family phenazine biosynthesis protein [Paenibacillus sp. BK720]|uniref:PhzF family phenazine biosynthesis protein n=1 Tax=Paenibacillus sp. BK720 TaxID=2587092 RepID=UPI00142058A8|nr:PhzF family phenazine biosynthesis protein [Paenibacillus sp. BK720]NIK68315.1 PhzF family phenazine biosynthesis protein [Paenibacillus sp. BK720]
MKPIYVADAFTSEPFRGNPAAVCLCGKPEDERWMQQVAAEINLPETAFLVPIEDGYDLRWFTPESEVDLGGHATLAAAYTLWHTGRLRSDQTARFVTKSGVLTVDYNAVDGWMTMDYPEEVPLPANAPEALIQGLGLIPRYTGKYRQDYMVEVDSEQTVRSLKPDRQQLAAAGGRGIIVTAKAAAEAPYDFVSRAFYPKAGIFEAAVSGVAHCALAPYWTRRLRKPELTGYQASKRGGIVKVAVNGSRVLLSGQAKMMLQGTLEV